MLNAMELAPRRPARGALLRRRAARARAARRSTTPKASSTCRSARRKSSAVALFKRQADGTYPRQPAIEGRRRRPRASPQRWDGGGHTNAAGCTHHRRLRRRSSAAMVDAIGDAVDRDALDARSSIPESRMDGVLLIDKPSGPTSHDVVARLRARRPASAASATPARSIRWRPACCRSCSAAPRGWRRSSRAATRPTTRRSDSASRPTPTTPTAGRSATATSALPDRRGDRRGARRRFAARSISCRRRTRPRRSAARRPTTWRGATSRSTLKPVTVTVRALDVHRPRGRPRATVVSRRQRASTCGRWRATWATRSGAAPTWPPCGGRAAGRSTSRTRCRSARPSGWARTSRRGCSRRPTPCRTSPAVTLTEAGPAAGAARQPAGPGAPGGPLGAAGRAARPAGPGAGAGRPAGRAGPLAGRRFASGRRPRITSVLCGHRDGRSL